MPHLWIKEKLFDLSLFEIHSKLDKANLVIDENLRLGKYVERLVSFELEQQDHISVLAENIQIQNGKITLGELDCILLRNKKPIHLEVIYKFYLYDDSIGDSEIEHFIGPNRKDSLLEKLTKLNDKQLPLLYSDICMPYLEKLNLKSENISYSLVLRKSKLTQYISQSLLI